jgi:Zn-dependent protease
VAQRTRQGSGARRHPEGWEVGRLVGVPVVLARSWFIIAAVITLMFGPVVASRSPGLGTGAYLVAFAYSVLLLFSVLVHELGHAVVSRLTGSPASRIVLNLWGGHTQFEAEAQSPGRSFVVAAVGPLANAVIAVVAWYALPLTTSGGVPELLLAALAVTNALVAGFNLVPGLPLDGGRMLEALIWKVTGDRNAGMTVAGWAGRLFAAGLVVWVLGRPLLAGRQPDLFTVVWAAMIGALLWQGAGQAIRGAQVRRRLGATTVASLMAPAISVPHEASVLEAVHARDTSGVREVVLVAADGRPTGVLDGPSADAVPDDRRAVVPAASAARALPEGAVVDVRLSGSELIEALANLSGQEWVALDPWGRVVGVLRSAVVVAAVMPSRR